MQMFKNWSLKARTLASFSGVAFFLVIVGGANIINQNSVVAKYKYLADVSSQNQFYVLEMSKFIHQMRSGINRLGLPNLPIELGNETRQLIPELIKKYEADEKKYLEVPFIEGEDKVWEPV